MIDVKMLIQTTELPKFKIKNRDINKLRQSKRPVVENELQKLVAIKENYKGTYQRLKFLNKFYLYSELSKHQHEHKTLGSPDIFNKPLDKFESEVMKIFNCNTKEWPICLYDFTYKNRIPQYLCYRTSKKAPVIIDDYFYGRKASQQIEE